MVRVGERGAFNPAHLISVHMKQFRGDWVVECEDIRGTTHRIGEGDALSYERAKAIFNSLTQP